MKWLTTRRNRGDLTGWSSEASPITSLQREVNRLFSDFFNDFTPASFATDERNSSFMPKIDLSQSDKEIRVSAELPGMDANDVDVSISHGILTIKGEKKKETSREDNGYSWTERSSGSFYREIALPDNIDNDNVDALFKKGVLEITIPKLSLPEKEVKKITVKS